MAHIMEDKLDSLVDALLDLHVALMTERATLHDRRRVDALRDEIVAEYDVVVEERDAARRGAE